MTTDKTSLTDGSKLASSVQKHYESMGKTDTRTAADVLRAAGDTYRERNRIYGDNFKTVGPVMALLHGPESAAPAATLTRTGADFTKWHLWELLIVKITRFANSGLTHVDSIHDAMVYAAMIEQCIAEEQEKSE